MAKKKVIVGLSGGVDSSVAAFLLQEQGFAVEGLFMKNWQADDDDDYCPAAQDLSDATAVAQKLGIPLHTVNFAKTYWDKVFSYFLDQYRHGFTPNPDVLCNKEIKFKAFLDHALSLGADAIATGHYARKLTDPTRLAKGLDNNKDQSYFLHQLTTAQLAPSLFPVGELCKNEVRRIAKDQGFITHDKKDSTGICFIGERKFKTFLQEYLLAQPGEMISADGKPIGRHEGLMYYTIGQRQGLHIGGQQDCAELPWYVVDKDIANNTLIVGQGHDHPMLFGQALQAKDPHWIVAPPALPLTCHAKIRYRQSDQQCTVSSDETGGLTVQFAEPQRAITPGQYIVFYQDDLCLGGAMICAKLP